MDSEAEQLADEAID